MLFDLSVATSTEFSRVVSGRELWLPMCLATRPIASLAHASPLCYGFELPIRMKAEWQKKEALLMRWLEVQGSLLNSLGEKSTKHGSACLCDWTPVYGPKEHAPTAVTSKDAWDKARADRK